MNALNALLFGLMGLVMEVLPVLFPSWFPRTGADQASSRALWLAFMGALQMAVGAGFVIRAHVFPMYARMAGLEPASAPNALPLPVVRGVTGR